MVKTGFIIGVLFAQFAFAQASPKTGEVLDSLFAVRHYEEAAISPDGRMVAWVERGQGKDEAGKSTAWIKDLRDPASKARRLTDDSAVVERGLAWSGDGKLAYFSDAGSEGQPQLYVTANPLKGGARKLTDVKGWLDVARWSPDGKTIAVLLTEGAARAGGPLEAVAPKTGVVESQILEQRLGLVDAKTGAVRQVTPADMYVYEYDWAPDGKRLAYTAAPGEGDDNWYIAKLYTIDAASGAVKMIHQPPQQMAIPRWSPDGSTIAFIGGLMSDEGSTGGEIYTIPADGGEAKDITPGRKSSPSWLAWLPSSQRILFTEHVSGETAIATVDLATGQTERVWHGAESDQAQGYEQKLSLTRDGSTAAVIRSSFSRPPEVWAGPLGAWQQVTHNNDGKPRQWGEARSLEWTNEGFKVQGWLVYPLDYDARRHYPMVVSIHGGPASERNPGWPGTFFDLTVLSARGYFVFFPNPRGSYGQGEAFTKANVKDFGYGDLRDILAGVDHVLKEYPVDPKRIGIAGWSYGGFMTMWAVTQTQRFRAAVSGAGLSNWQSYYGENSIDQWMIPYFGASVYDDPAVYAKSSAINFIKNVKTPTLVVVGELDGECPAPQSHEFWHALKTLGVKTELVVYPGEGHRFRKPEHIRDLMSRTLAWFDDNMAEEPHGK